MSFSVGAGGVWKSGTAGAPKVGAGGVWKDWLDAWVGAGGVWKLFYSAGMTGTYSGSAVMSYTPVFPVEFYTVGSYSPATDSNGMTMGAAQDVYSASVHVVSTFSISGFSSDPGATNFTNIGGTPGWGRPSATATYGYSAGTASWSWGAGLPLGIGVGATTVTMS